MTTQQSRPAGFLTPAAVTLLGDAEAAVFSEPRIVASSSSNTLGWKAASHVDEYMERGSAGTIFAVRILLLGFKKIPAPPLPRKSPSKQFLKVLRICYKSLNKPPK